MPASCLCTRTSPKICVSVLNTMVRHFADLTVRKTTGAIARNNAAAARAFARRGCRVVAVARRVERLRALVEDCRESSPDCVYLAGDLGERAFAERVVDETAERFGGVDFLINNAAMPCHTSIYEISAEDAERVMRVNFFSCLWTTFAAIPHMLRTGGGHIVNVSSFATRLVPPHETLYAASKFAMNGFTEGLWNDLEGSGIRAALVVPGPIDTEIWSKLERPTGFRGRRYPPEQVVDGIFECIEKGVDERVVPKRNPMLTLGRWVRLLAPRVARRGAARMDPLDPEALERARRRALELSPPR